MSLQCHAMTQQLASFCGENVKPEYRDKNLTEEENVYSVVFLSFFKYSQCLFLRDRRTLEPRVICYRSGDWTY
jgi:hypothetical protein